MAGIVPSLLPAFSAPIGVRSAPSRATSASDSFADAGAANATRVAAATAEARILLMFFIYRFSPNLIRTSR
jgi:hypothetical protein